MEENRFDTTWRQLVSEHLRQFLREMDCMDITVSDGWHSTINFTYKGRRFYLYYRLGLSMIRFGFNEEGIQQRVPLQAMYPHTFKQKLDSLVRNY